MNNAKEETVIMINSYLLRFQWEFDIIFYKSTNFLWIAFYAFALFCTFVPFNFRWKLPAPWNSETGGVAENRAKSCCCCCFSNNKVKGYNSNDNNNNNKILELPAFLKLWGPLGKGGSNTKYLCSHVLYPLKLCIYVTNRNFFF